MKPEYKAFSDRIKAAGRDKSKLQALEKRIEKHYNLGTLSTTEFKTLDLMIFNRQVTHV